MSVLLLFGWLHACTGEQSVRHVSERRAKVRECPRVDDEGCPSLRVLSVNTPVILIENRRSVQEKFENQEPKDWFKVELQGVEGFTAGFIREDVIEWEQPRTTEEIRALVAAEIAEGLKTPSATEVSYRYIARVGMWAEFQPETILPWNMVVNLLADRKVDGSEVLLDRAAHRRQTQAVRKKFPECPKNMDPPGTPPSLRRSWSAEYGNTRVMSLHHVEEVTYHWVSAESTISGSKGTNLAIRCILDVKLSETEHLALSKVHPDNRIHE